jgi:hypothetical protein
VVLQKPQKQFDRLPPCHSSSYSNLGFQVDSYTYGSSHVHTTRQLTNTRHSDDVPHLDSRLTVNHNREESTLGNEIPEESDQFLFLRPTCYSNIKGSVGLILTKGSVMRISIPLDLSSRSFMTFPCFIRSRRPLPLLDPSLVFTPCLLWNPLHTSLDLPYLFNVPVGGIVVRKNTVFQTIIKTIIKTSHIQYHISLSS